MNFFYFDSDIERNAQYHCDRHCLKMIIEYAQMLSTAHRILDGVQYISKTESGRKKINYKLEFYDDVIYKATHINHPSTKWVRYSKENYLYVYNTMIELGKVFSHRYEKPHKTIEKLSVVLSEPPKNIISIKFTEPPLAMPDDCKMETVIDSYRNYFKTHKMHIATWKNTETPYWINQ